MQERHHSRSAAKAANTKPLKLALALGVLLGALAFSLAHAQLPSAQTENGIEYVTGGIGQEESNAFKQAKSTYPLAVTFAATGPGSATPYVAQVKVEITKGQGDTVFSAPSVGPYLLARLEPGNYTLSATYEGETQTRDFNVKEGGTTDLRMTWDRPSTGPD